MQFQNKFNEDRAIFSKCGMVRATIESEAKFINKYNLYYIRLL